MLTIIIFNRPWRKRNLGTLLTKIRTLKQRWNIMKKQSSMTPPTWLTYPTKQVHILTWGKTFNKSNFCPLTVWLVGVSFEMTAVLSVQLCISRREILRSAERCVRRPSMLAERTGKTTDRLQSEFCKKWLFVVVYFWPNLGESTHTTQNKFCHRIYLIWMDNHMPPSSTDEGNCLKNKTKNKTPLGGSIVLLFLSLMQWRWLRKQAILCQSYLRSFAPQEFILLKWSTSVFWIICFWVVFS